MDELLTLLRRNALESTANIAKMLRIPESDVRAKIAEYETKGVIKGYMAVVNEDQLDTSHVRAVIEVKVTPEREGGFDHVATRIARFPEVESLFLMSGAYDLLVFVKGPDLKTVATFVSGKLATIQGVISTATHFMLKTYKDQGILMESEAPNERLSVSP